MYKLNKKDFNYISRRVYDHARINLTEKKHSLVVSRLTKRVRALGMSGFEEYVDFLKNRDQDNREFNLLVDAVSTNFTSFFREPHHMDFLRDTVFPEIRGDMNIWSAASSTGQEIFSILITLREYERESKRKITARYYASDISRNVLRKASTGVFSEADIERLPTEMKRRYFLKGKGDRQGLIKVKPELIRKITFFHMNLMDEEYRLPVMDVIFLRNVIIYFDVPTKVELINRLHRYLKPGGYLFLGHSESLSGISDKFQTMGKTVYRRL